MRWTTSCKNATIPDHFCSGLTRSIHSAGTRLSYFDVLCMISHPPSGHRSRAPLPSWVNTEIIKSITTVYTTFNAWSLFWKGTRLRKKMQFDVEVSTLAIMTWKPATSRSDLQIYLSECEKSIQTEGTLFAHETPPCGTRLLGPKDNPVPSKTPGLRNRSGSREGKHFLLSKCLQTFILLKTQDRFHLSPCTSCTHRYYTAWAMSR